ncbi:hypothetical protein [Azospirillum sp. TSO35-2]|uniref:hypothetical protein n=1 Tax=Azospirillum sp. TSO35-2 TaxID=716796 RepID=UPI000D611EED|nr:hypothetical protein [Azospirillum sp. TSO35-2]PWC33789.1 hypothetical protein TSO352_25745 [Azospirillum sp. TSO35-2]
MTAAKTAATVVRVQVWLAVSLGALALGGCTSPLGLAAAGADVVTLNATRKTIGDHVVSSATGRDCSIISFTETGDYCPDKVVVDRSKVYCFRTLADVECHHIPDPYRNGTASLASPPPDIRPVPRKRGWFDDATPYTANNGS